LASGLFAHYTFDDCLLMDETGLQVDATAGNNAWNCDCSVLGEGVQLGGNTNDYLEFEGTFDRIFGGEFTLSFYVRPENTGGIVDILSLSDSCGGTGFYINYIPVNESIVFEIETELGARRDVVGTIDPRSCWQHVVVTRSGKRFTMFINGEVKAVEEVGLKLDFSGLSTLRLANSVCLNSPGQLERLRGVFDELRIYNKVLSSSEIAGFYFSPDKLFTQDTLVFQGDGVKVRAGASCGTTIQWTPTSGVDDPSVINPTITPAVTTDYTLRISYSGCTLMDSLRIIVTEKDSLDCSNLLIPTAFSPNGDGLNDVLAISNPFLVDNIEEWVIFDRWGSRVFDSVDPLSTWDGNVSGQAIPAGIFGYRIIYNCKGETFKKIGSVYLLR